MGIGKIASCGKYWRDEQFHNFPVFRAKFWFSNLKIPKTSQFIERNFDFSTWKNSRSLLIFQFEKFQKFLIWKIPKIFQMQE